MKEFILLDKEGKALDYIDPIEKFDEDDKYWVVDNGHDIYKFAKRDGRSHVIRERTPEGKTYEWSDEAMGNWEKDSK